MLPTATVLGAYEQFKFKKRGLHSVPFKGDVPKLNAAVINGSLALDLLDTFLSDLNLVGLKERKLQRSKLSKEGLNNPGGKSCRMRACGPTLPNCCNQGRPQHLMMKVWYGQP